MKLFTALKDIIATIQAIPKACRATIATMPSMSEAIEQERLKEEHTIELKKILGTNPTLQNLYNLVEKDDKSRNMFDSISLGLSIQTQSRALLDFATPINSWNFLQTGGDSVHYSFLCDNGILDENNPVIMTVPCGKTLNVIVAENLLEFISLAYVNGGFSLDSLAGGSIDEYCDKLDNSTLKEEIFEDESEFWKEVAKERKIALALIYENFEIQPFKSPHKDRLLHLQEKYIDKLKYSDEYIGKEFPDLHPQRFS
ncbi:hypothetical protein MK079_04980 [Candidatus Gracilibacteria bacterium]|nr:hypothetical protein [Candidatus Gracilibacteria bacterium]